MMELEMIALMVFDFTWPALILGTMMLFFTFGLAVADGFLEDVILRNDWLGACACGLRIFDRVLFITNVIVVAALLLAAISSTLILVVASIV